MPNSDRTSERRRGDLLVQCAVAAFFLAVLAAPLVKTLVEWLFYYGETHYNFARVYARLLQVFAVILLLVHARELQVGRRLRAALTSADHRRATMDASGGALLAFAAMYLFDLVAHLTGDVAPGSGRLPSTPRTLKMVTVTTLVSVLEEFLFGAIILTILIEARGTLMGVISRGLFFSLLHLLRADFHIGQGRGGEECYAGFGFSPWIGIETLWNATKHLRGELWFYDITEMLGLFVFSTLLSIAFLRTRNLYLAIGLHWGIVLAMRSRKIWAVPVDDSSVWMIGRYTTHASPWGFAILIVLTLLVSRWPRGAAGARGPGR